MSFNTGDFVGIGTADEAASAYDTLRNALPVKRNRLLGCFDRAWVENCACPIP